MHAYLLQFVCQGYSVDSRQLLLLFSAPACLASISTEHKGKKKSHDIYVLAKKDKKLTPLEKMGSNELTTHKICIQRQIY